MSEKWTEIDQERIYGRLRAMGLHARRMQGDRCVLASLRIDETLPFRSLEGSFEVREIVFSCVDRDRIKCLHPSPFFMLPLLRIADCRDAASIEARIRLGWQTYMTELRSAANWFDKLGAPIETTNRGTLLTLDIAGEGRPNPAHVRQPGHVILPGRGRLSGIVLEDAGDRRFGVAPEIDTAIDLEIAIANRCEELGQRTAERGEQQRRLALQERRHPARLESRRMRRRICLVGPRIAHERSCIDSRRLREYEVDIATTPAEALQIFSRRTPELVIADLNLGRSEGIELIPALRTLVGIEDIPVVLVDSHYRKARLEAIRRAGAVGYLSYPLDVSRIARPLQAALDTPRRRRFTRYPRKLSVTLDGAEESCTTSFVGRGGLLLRTPNGLEPNSLHTFELSLHEIGATIEAEAEALYTVPMVDCLGVGARFRAFTANDESTLIHYIQAIQRSPASP